MACLDASSSPLTAAALGCKVLVSRLPSAGQGPANCARSLWTPAGEAAGFSSHPKTAWAAPASQVSCKQQTDCLMCFCVMPPSARLAASLSLGQKFQERPLPT